MMSQPKTILIVEDEFPLLKMLIDKFSQEGFSVLEARDGEAALVLALKEHPDMILLDIVMPKMDGMTMLKKLRQDAWGKKVNVILLTNLSDSETVAEAMADGAYEYLVKSDWSLNDVVIKVKEKLLADEG